MADDRTVDPNKRLSDEELDEQIVDAMAERATNQPGAEADDPRQVPPPDASA